jgi:tripartite-type tricarboxylate transporter receptor subunit TctC
MQSRSKTFWRAAAGVLTAVLVAPVQAQQVVRLVTGSSPGAGTDTVARVVAEAMGPLLKKTVIVESKPGAAYNIAADYVAKAPPDGNTVLVTFNVHPIAGALNPHLSYDPVKDFRAIGMIAATPYVIVANPSLPGTNLKEMIALAKTQGSSPTFGSIGLGTPQHLMMERLKGQTGVNVRMVHYKSATQAMTDVIAGHVDFSLLTVSTAEAQVKSGKLKVLAVTTPQRMQQFPDAPTIAETGYKDFITDGWYAMMLPSRTPPAIVQAYNGALNEVLGMPAVVERLRTLGATPVPGTPEVLDRRVREDAAMWRKVITANNIKPE